MHVIHRRGWELPEHQATPERLFFDRRQLLAAAGTAALALSPALAQAQRLSDLANLPDPSASLYPAKRNEKFTLDRPITDEAINTTYNNYYEFGSAKALGQDGQQVALHGDLHVFHADAWHLGHHQYVVLFLEDVHDGFANFLYHGVPGCPVLANVAERLDAGLVVVSQPHFDREPVDSFQLLAQSVNLTGLG